MKYSTLRKENAQLRAENNELDHIIRTFLRGGAEAALMRQQLLYQPEYSNELATVAENIIACLGLADRIAEMKNKAVGETADQITQ